MTLWFLLCWVFGGGLAHASELQKVRVFAGNEHARVLVLVSEDIETVETRSSPPTASAPARATLHLPGARRSKAVQQRIPIGKAGIRQIQIVEVGDGLQFTMELDQVRTLTAQKISDSAILIDLLPLDGKPDDTLPTAQHIEAWLQGVSLSRMAKRAPRDRKLIVVDAGHGGFDHGAIGTVGTREADIALELARRTAELLESRLDVDVIMTRNRDIHLNADLPPRSREKTLTSSP